eukprot:CAMPEP_0173314626 /NCGR_PEP_ID=MMETSP1143-20121109/25438_1 /TAXON_ID=483371 /ORGANISM="non described non described, Strain CCMP2298" /LENGTH=149 /DNA_ID=CAMNT_0014257245 /DNA_START=62 /DNA_END=508 /DNA_ORIENTATION=-
MADHDHLYLEALQNYLNGGEWRQSVEMFVESNCKFFDRTADLDHQHHSLWRTFQEIVETILDMALANCGGSLRELERALDEVQGRESRGPREELVKDVLDKLLAFDDFQSFAAMMKRARDSQQQAQTEGTEGENMADTLIRMGFKRAAV